MDCRKLILETEAYGSPYRALIIIGTPGAGKGTYGRFIAGETGSFYFSLGDLYRKFHKTSVLGKVFHDFASKAEALPDDYASATCIRGIQANIFLGNYNPATDLIIIDGYPKSSTQFISMKAFLSVVAVINLKCSQEETMRRILNRQNKNQRAEDSKRKLIERRINDFEEMTRPILPMFNHVGVPIYTFDTECHIGFVKQAISAFLSQRFNGNIFTHDNLTKGRSGNVDTTF